MSKKDSKNNRSALSIIKKVCLYSGLFFIFSFLLVAGVAGGFYASLVKDEPVRSYDELKAAIYDYEETASLYFSDNKYMGKLRSELYRDEVSLENVSPLIISALISTEDEGFYEHTGVDYFATIRALLQEFLNSSTQTGGSTLTQQLIKNQLLSSEVSYERKAKEILLAKRVERYFTKDEILEAYLNVSPFGRNSSGQHIAGIETAAEGIFGISAKEVNLAQAAFLAGLPQSPYGYTPFTSEGKVKEDITPVLKRTEYVLKRMLKLNAITQEEFDEAMAFDFKKSFAKPKKATFEKYPYLTMEIENRATEIVAKHLVKEDKKKWTTVKKDSELYRSYINKAHDNLRKKGYNIHTTIDKNIYIAMQKAKDNFPYYGGNISVTETNPETGVSEVKSKQVELGATLIENSTGRIISFVGGRDFAKEQLNHATKSKRQNGSTMKPLLVYAPALEYGLVQPGSIIPDIETTYAAGSESYSPQNFDYRYHGLVDARAALKYSYNIPAVRIYKDIVSRKPAEYLKKMGFTSLHPGDYENLSMALGGMTEGVTVEENTNAFATFANGGDFVDAYMIEKITDKNGEVIFKHKVKKSNVFSEQTSYLMVDMMRDVITSGTGSRLNNYLKFSADWAGKTGTSQNYNDLWFVASNPSISMGLWLGYDKLHSLDQTTRNNQMNLWATLMNAAYDEKPELIDPDTRFVQPNGIVSRSYCSLSGLIPSSSCSQIGKVRSDIYNSKFVPNKVDNSLTSDTYVRIGDKAYKPLSSTPSEFIKSGYVLQDDFFTQLNISKNTPLSQLFPECSLSNNLVVFEDTLPPNSAGAPLTVGKVTKSKNVLTWSPSGSSDVIGYYIYHSGIFGTSYSKVGRVAAGQSLSFTVSKILGSYYVTAVDIEGNESAPSQAIKYQDQVAPPVTENPEEPEEPEIPSDTNPGENQEGPTEEEE